MKLGVVLAVAEPLFRLGMRMACERGGMRVVAEAEDRITLCGAVDAAVEPRVVVSEAALLEPDAPGAVRELTVTHRVLVIAGGALDRPSLLRAGASGFVRRDVDADALCRAVAAAHRGDLVVVAADLTGAPATAAVHLTRRELEVLRLIADGRSTATAARELHLSPTTLKTHLRNASAKLGAPSRAAAVARAAALGHLG